MGPQKILTFVETFPLSFLPSVARTIHASRLLRRTDGRQFPSLVVVVVVEGGNANRNCGGGFDNGEGRISEAKKGGRKEGREGERGFFTPFAYKANRGASKICRAFEVA